MAVTTSAQMRLFDANIHGAKSWLATVTRERRGDLRNKDTRSGFDAGDEV